MEEDIELYEVVSGLLSEAMNTISERKLGDLLDDWAKGHIDYEPDDEALEPMMAIAVDACLHAPSMSGATPMSRYIASVKIGNPVERQALKIMARSEIRAVRIVERIDPDLVELQDSMSGERLELIDGSFSEACAGLDALMRLCRLDSGRYLMISFPFVLTEALRHIVETFVRPGKGISNGYRCALAVYKHAVREGIIEIPQRELTEEELDQLEGAQAEEVAAALDAQWVLAKDDPEIFAELEDEFRNIADANSALSYLHIYSLALNDQMPVSAENFREICAIVIDEVLQQHRSAAAEADDELGKLKQAVAELVATDKLDRECQVLLDSLVAAGDGVQQ